MAVQASVEILTLVVMPSASTMTVSSGVSLGKACHTIVLMNGCQGAATYRAYLVVLMPITEVMTCIADLSMGMRFGIMTIFDITNRIARSNAIATSFSMPVGQSYGRKQRHHHGRSQKQRNRFLFHLGSPMTLSAAMGIMRVMVLPFAVMVAGWLGCARKAPRQQLLYCFVHAAGYPATEPDACLRQSTLRAATNSAADQRVHTVFFQKIDQCSMPAATGIKHAGSTHTAFAGFIHLEPFCVSKVLKHISFIIGYRDFHLPHPPALSIVLLEHHALYAPRLLAYAINQYTDIFGICQ